MINGSEVIEPCPISVAADMIVMVPSGPRLTHGFSAWLSAWPPDPLAISAASALRASAIAKDSPAAPIIAWRRETCWCETWPESWPETWRESWPPESLRDRGAPDLLKSLFMSRLPRRALDRAHDALIGAAAANIGAHMLDNLLAARLRIVFEEIGRAHDLAGLAVAALRHALGEPGFLHRMV